MIFLISIILLNQKKKKKQESNLAIEVLRLENDISHFNLAI